MKSDVAPRSFSTAQALEKSWFRVYSPIVITQGTAAVNADFRPFSESSMARQAAGANIITFHPEATDHVDRSLALIRDAGASVWKSMVA